MADTPVSPPTPVVPTAAPNRNTTTDPLAYSQIADAWAGSLPAYNAYLLALGANVEFNAESAFDSAAEALASQIAAEAAANAAESASGAVLWVSGQSYLQGDAAVSLINFLTYRANTNTSGTTDPSASSDWVLIGGNVTTTGTQTLTNKTIVDPILTLGGGQGTAGQVPVSQGLGSAPVWGDVGGGIDAVGPTVTTDATLTASSPGYQFVQMASLGKSITLPAANTMTVGGPKFIIDNSKGGYPCGIRDNAGTLIMAVAAGGEAYVSLKDNSTAAGDWSVTGSNLEPGLITIDNTFSSTYASTVLAPFVALDANTSIHFAALSSGFAAFVVDNVGEVISTPVTVSAAAGDKPYTAFKVSTTSAILFYGSGATSQAVVLTLSGASPSLTISVGTPQSPADANAFAAEDFVGAPKIVQLTSTLYLASYVQPAATKSIAVSVSGATVTIGTAASIIASGSVGGSTTTYALTATTALVLYKSGSAAPYANNAVVVSVSGTTCTIGTPVALGGVSSTGTNPPVSVLVSPTKAIVGDNNNSTAAFRFSSIAISGTTVTATITNLDAMDSAVGWASGGYTTNSATRYNPHLWTLSTGATNRVGFWYFDSSGVSRVVVLSENGGTITKGTILYKSISTTTNQGAGRPMPQGGSSFVALRRDAQSGVTPKLIATPHLINGSEVSTGIASQLDGPIAGFSPATGAGNFVRLSSGNHVVVASYQDDVCYALPVFKENGGAINSRGFIKIPSLNVYFGVAVQGYPAVDANRMVIIGAATQSGSTVSASVDQLRLINVEIAA